jgi:hypothetical protein
MENQNCKNSGFILIFVGILFCAFGILLINQDMNFNSKLKYPDQLNNKKRKITFIWQIIGSSICCCMAPFIIFTGTGKA